MRVKDIVSGEEWEFCGNAWTLGGMTRLEGFDAGFNPYKPGSDKFKSWRAGWHAAKAPAPSEGTGS